MKRKADKIDLINCLNTKYGLAVTTLILLPLGADKLNSNFAKFAMANLSGWSDKQQVSGDAANPLAFLLQKADGQSKDLVNEDS